MKEHLPKLHKAHRFAPPLTRTKQGIPSDLFRTQQPSLSLAKNGLASTARSDRLQSSRRMPDQTRTLAITSATLSSQDRGAELIPGLARGRRPWIVQRTLCRNGRRRWRGNRRWVDRTNRWEPWRQWRRDRRRAWPLRLMHILLLHNSLVHDPTLTGKLNKTAVLGS